MALPPGPALPRAVQAVLALTASQRALRRLRGRYGDAFTLNLPVFGQAVLISDPAQIRQLFQTRPDAAENIEPNLGRMLGPGSMFALTGEEHRRQRKLLVPPFHGRRLAAYERIVEEETVRELASWPEGREFAILPSTNRITLNAILRAVFGAEGADLVELRDLLPKWVALGSRLATLPMPRTDLGRWSPWGRFRRYRRTYDEVIARLIATAEREGGLDERDDVLALLLQARYDDGSAMSHSDIADQLLTLLTAGHETTATTLAWAVERLRRHPAVLRDLVAEADEGGRALREATITEVQRIRPVIDLVGRIVTAESLELGKWTLPRGTRVLVSIGLIHDNAELFPGPRTFDPYRFTRAKPDLYQWIPFGGGTRRCIGAAFANMEMHVVLRTMLRDFTLVPTLEKDERRHFRGVANAPSKGGMILVHRRAAAPAEAVTTGAEARP